MVRVNPDGSITVGVIDSEQPKKVGADNPVPTDKEKPEKPAKKAAKKTSKK